MAHGLSCSAACGIFPDQGSNPCPLHWQADSQPLLHQSQTLTQVGKGSLQFSGDQVHSGRNPTLTAAGWAVHASSPLSPSQPCSWPLCSASPSGLLPPCSSSLAITSFTLQLQVHSHQDVFLSKPFFSVQLYLVPAV